MQKLNLKPQSYLMFCRMLGCYDALQKKYVSWHFISNGPKIYKYENPSNINFFPASLLNSSD